MAAYCLLSLQQKTGSLLLSVPPDPVCCDHDFCRLNIRVQVFWPAGHMAQFLRGLVLPSGCKSRIYERTLCLKSIDVFCRKCPVSSEFWCSGATLFAVTSSRRRSLILTTLLVLVQKLASVNHVPHNVVMQEVEIRKRGDRVPLKNSKLQLLQCWETLAVNSSTKCCHSPCQNKSGQHHLLAFHTCLCHFHISFCAVPTMQHISVWHFQSLLVAEKASGSSSAPAPSTTTPLCNTLLSRIPLDTWNCTWNNIAFFPFHTLSQCLLPREEFVVVASHLVTCSVPHIRNLILRIHWVVHNAAVHQLRRECNVSPIKLYCYCTHRRLYIPKHVRGRWSSVLSQWYLKRRSCFILL